MTDSLRLASIAKVFFSAFPCLPLSVLAKAYQNVVQRCCPLIEDAGEEGQIIHLAFLAKTLKELGETHEDDIFIFAEELLRKLNSQANTIILRICSEGDLIICNECTPEELQEIFLMELAYIEEGICAHLPESKMVEGGLEGDQLTA